MRMLLIALGAMALTGCQSFQEDWNRAFNRQPSTPPAQTAEPASVTTTSATAMRSAEEELLEAERRLSANAQTAGLGGAVSGVFDAHGFVMRPGVLYTTPDTVERGLNAPGAGPVFWQADRVFVSQSGDMGVTSGRYVQVVAGAEAVQGRYLVVWRRDSAGAWRVLSETRTPDPPTATRRR